MSKENLFTQILDYRGAPREYNNHINYRLIYQWEALKSLLEPTFENCCMVCKVNMKNIKNEDNNDCGREKFEFTLKGAIRCEMGMGSAGNSSCIEARRLAFGTSKGSVRNRSEENNHDKNKKKFISNLISNLIEFSTDKTQAEDERYRKWKGLVLPKVFNDKKSIKDFLSHCPVSCWRDSKDCPLLNSVNDDAHNGWWCLLQFKNNIIKVTAKDIYDHFNFYDYYRINEEVIKKFNIDKTMKQKSISDIKKGVTNEFNIDDPLNLKELVNSYSGHKSNIFAEVTQSTSDDKKKTKILEALNNNPPMKREDLDNKLNKKFSPEEIDTILHLSCIYKPVNMAISELKRLFNINNTEIEKTKALKDLVKENPYTILYEVSLLNIFEKFFKESKVLTHVSNNISNNINCLNPETTPPIPETRKKIDNLKLNFNITHEINGTSLFFLQSQDQEIAEITEITGRIKEKDKAIVNEVFTVFDPVTGIKQVKGIKISGIKGLFRNASAFLLKSLNKKNVQITDKVLAKLNAENINTGQLKNLLNKEFTEQSLTDELKRFKIDDKQIEIILKHLKITCEFDIVPNSKTCNCPICKLYGPSREKEGKDKRLFSISIKNNKPEDVLLGKEELEVNYPFAWNQIIRQGQNSKGYLTVSPLTLTANQTLSIRLETGDPFYISLVCLTSDLISSGHFRAGRLGTRGYGLLRLKPEDMVQITNNTNNIDELKPLLDKYFYKEDLKNKLNELKFTEDEIKQILSNNSREFKGGYDLAKAITGEDPLEILKDYLNGQKDSQ